MKRMRIMTGVAALCGMLVLILDNQTALDGAQNGIEICLRSVIPTLFPFMVLSGLLTDAFWGERIPVLKVLGRCFCIPDGGESLLIPAFCGGYPAGAQSIAQAYHAGNLNKAEAEQMLAYCNNAGPSFIFGMISGAFASKWYPWAMWGVQLLGAFAASHIFCKPNSKISLSGNRKISASHYVNLAVVTMAKVCGWVILFRIFLSFADKWLLWSVAPGLKTLIYGILELSNGCCTLNWISNESIRFLAANIMLSMGGLCVIMQTLSVIGDLSPKMFFYGKAVQIGFSTILSVLIIFKIWIMIPVSCMILFLLGMKREKSCSIPKKLVV